MDLEKAIKELQIAQANLKYLPDTLVADIVLMGLTSEVIENALVVDLLAQTPIPHRAFSNARTAFEAAQQATVLATNEDYSLAGARAWIYFRRKDRDWLKLAKPDDSGITTPDDAEKWFQKQITKMADIWNSIAPGNGQTLFKAKEILDSQPRRPDNWLGKNMAHLQVDAYAKFADMLGGTMGNDSNDSVEINRSIYSMLSREAHAGIRFDPVHIMKNKDNSLDVYYEPRDKELNSRSVSVSAAISAHEAMMALVYRSVKVR